MLEFESGRPTFARVTPPALLLAFAVAATPLRASAEEEPSAHLSGVIAEGEDAPANHLIWAARACYIEATFRESDCVALLWVARKRAEGSARGWLELLSDYSAVRANNPRAEEVRSFPWADVSNKTNRWNRNWERLRQLVVEFASGQHADPCPRARHWGGTMDYPHGRMVPARCSIVTANTFYAVRAWRNR
jgi:hypothetical protein